MGMPLSTPAAFQQQQEEEEEEEELRVDLGFLSLNKSLSFHT
jgi:hypothetical protein